MRKFKEYLGVTKAELLNADCGIEVEMEVNHWHGRRVAGWSAHHDDSLRGESIEMVSQPIKWEDSIHVLDNLHNSIVRNDVEIKNSFRAGVHVHVNMLNKTLIDVAKLAQTYAILEDTLINYCGNNRKSNLFCLRFVDAEAAVDKLCLSLKDGDISYLNTDAIRYSSLNLRALLVHGTVEFRSLQTPTDLREINTWVNLIRRMVEWSNNMDSLQSIIEMFSMNGARDFVKEVVGEELWPIVEKHFDQRDTIVGMRIAQQIAQYKYM